jgi:hypothetical protein
LALALATLVTLGVPLIPPAGAQSFVPTDDLEHPRVMYADSTVSVNDRCVVRQGKLNPNYLPVYVNGYPIGFC